MKAGDYVRTKNYGIAKILNIYNNTTTNYSSITLDKIDSFGRLGVNISNNNIISSSSNIIDLIEVKDIITFQCISDDYDFEYKEQYTNQINNKDELESFKEAVENEDLKLISIVTKEQFESMEYKVGEL